MFLLLHLPLMPLFVHPVVWYQWTIDHRPSPLDWLTCTCVDGYQEELLPDMLLFNQEANVPGLLNSHSIMTIVVVCGYHQLRNV